MAKLILSFIFVFYCLSSISQEPFIPDEKYLALKDQAFDSLLKSKYKASGLLYDSAFKASNGKAKADDRYYAAFVWEMAGNKIKGLNYLKQAVTKEKFSNLSQITGDVKVLKFMNDTTWEPYIGIVKKNKDEKEAKVDKALITQLSIINKEDQTGRLMLDSVQKKYGLNSKEVNDLWTTINYKDSINRTFIKNLIDSRGWLGEDIIGAEGNRTLFLVIQHADPATQEKYLPVMRKAVKDGNAEAASLALLEDRTRMNRGEKQIYGSQVRMDPATKKWKFYPIEDEPNVNKRRASVGLRALEEYAKYLGIDYKLPE